jgi:hypothetical protein
MLFTSFLVAASALSGFVAAQNNETNKNLPPGINDCCTVDANLVPKDKKQQWCQAQRNTCPDLCGGIPELAKDGQDCNQVGSCPLARHSMATVANEKDAGHS